MQKEKPVCAAHVFAPSEPGLSDPPLVMAGLARSGNAKTELEAEATARDTKHLRSGLARAHQEVPPAVRRAVLRRDGGRCVVPGCRAARFLDIHHLKPRAKGGGHDLSNLATICAAHHRAIHRGEVLLEGSVVSGLRVLHADGTRYGRVVLPETALARERVFGALTHMGFQRVDVERALETVFSQDSSVVSAESALRQALARLTPRASSIVS